MRGKFWLVMAGLFGAIGVAMGAYQAHGLSSSLEEILLDPVEIKRRLGFAETAYRYQQVHALALLGVGVFLRTWPVSRVAKLAGAAFVIGVFLFCGALYGLAFTGHEVYAQIAPIGGFALIVGWLLLALTGLLTPDVAASGPPPGGSST